MDTLLAHLLESALNDAVSQTLIVSICIVVLAVAGYIAKKLLGKRHDSLHFKLTCDLTRKEPRTKAQTGPKRITQNRKQL